MMKLGAGKIISENLGELFPDLSLVGTNEYISNNYWADLHFKDENDNDIFIEIKLQTVNHNEVGSILDKYSILLNTESTRNPRLILLVRDIQAEAERTLIRFGVQVLRFRDLSISDKQIEGLGAKNTKNSLTGVESRILSIIKERNCPIVIQADLVNEFNIESNYLSKILERLKNKAYLEKIQRGKYLFIPLEYGYKERYPPMNALVVGSVLVDPYYFGYHTANRYYGFTTQFSPRTYICTTKAKRTFKWRNLEFKFVKIEPRKFIGVKKVQSDNCVILLSDKEKTVLDSVDKPDYCGGMPQVAAVISNAFNKELSREKLLRYVEEMGSSTVIQRLGYLSELLMEHTIIKKDSEFIASLKDLISKTVSNTYLDSVSNYGRKGSINDQWHVIENIERNNLLSEIQIR